MTILNETYTLTTGATIPKLGLGTWMIDDDQVADAVRSALEIGYRNIDTAQAYGNERGVGEGVRSGGVDRSELFVSTKLAIIRTRSVIGSCAVPPNTPLCKSCPGPETSIP